MNLDTTPAIVLVFYCECLSVIASPSLADRASFAKTVVGVGFFTTIFIGVVTALQRSHSQLFNSLSTASP